MIYYTKAKDVFTQRRTIDGKFEEYPLIVYPNGFVMTDSCNNLVVMDSASVASGFTDIKVKVSDTDTTASFLLSKITAGPNIGLMHNNAGGNESVTIYSTALSETFKSKVDITDIAADYLSLKLLAGENIIINQTNDPIYGNKLYISASVTGGGSYLALNQSIPQSVVNGAPIFQGGFNSTAYQMTGSIFNYQSSTYTLTNADNGKIISVNSGSTVYINISQSLDATFNCMIYQSGSGQVSFRSENGTFIRNRLSSTLTGGQYAIVTLLRVSNTDFILAGDVA